MDVPRTRPCHTSAYKNGLVDEDIVKNYVVKLYLILAVSVRIYLYPPSENY